MVVQHNIPAMNANRYFNVNNSGLSKSLEKLSSGYAINRAGDNAAGLAVSEKMRSQIAGLTQGVKNAQDGISMIQTYEGALDETDKILQRMKTLANQSANGTYQNEVDREAIQLEFDQLNDELDQIADTDFNGVVMLNGGEMADGTKAAKDGSINYVANDPRTEAAQLGSSDINTLDNNKYDATASDNLWKNLGLTTKDDSVEITFKYDKTSDTWSAVDASSMTAKNNLANITVDKGSTATKNNGGFSVKNSTTLATESDLTGAPAAANEIANVVLDSSSLVDGDTVTVKFTRVESTNTAPENIGMEEGSYSAVNAGSAATVAKATLTVNGGAAAAGNYESTNSATAKTPMTEAAMKAFNGLDGAKIELTQTTKNDAANDVASRTIKITLADGTSKSLTTASDAGDPSTASMIAEDGTKYSLSFAADGKLTISDKDGKELASVAAGAVSNGTADAADTITEKFTIALDEARYSADNVSEASIVEPPKSTNVSKSDSNNAATAPLTYTNHLTLQSGARTKDSVDFTFTYNSKGIGDLKSNMNCSSRSDGLGTKDLSLSTQKDANAAIDKIDNAINKVSMVRATFGATQNRLEHKIDNMNVTKENITSAESRIRDTDMAAEMTNFTKNQILSQASQAMLAQANQLPQGVLQLLG